MSLSQPPEDPLGIYGPNYADMGLVLNFLRTLRNDTTFAIIKEKFMTWSDPRINHALFELEKQNKITSTKEGRRITFRAAVEVLLPKLELTLSSKNDNSSSIVKLNNEESSKKRKQGNSDGNHSNKRSDSVSMSSGKAFPKKSLNKECFVRAPFAIIPVTGSCSIDRIPKDSQRAEVTMKSNQFLNKVNSEAALKAEVAIKTSTAVPRKPNIFKNVEDKENQGKSAVICSSSHQTDKTNSVSDVLTNAVSEILVKLFAQSSDMTSAEAKTAKKAIFESTHIDEHSLKQVLELLQSQNKIFVNEDMIYRI